jgi:hypothetical protein
MRPFWGRVVATEPETRKYDRDFLLSPAKRNQLVELWEVEKYGRDCFSDPDHVHLYGLPPKVWYEKGVRILARTCLEAVKDPLGNKIGRDIAEVVLQRSAPVPSESSIHSQAHATLSTRFCGICRAQRVLVLRSSPPSSI